MTLKPEQITALRNVDISTVDKSRLADMSRIKLDNSLSKAERLNRILRTAKIPIASAMAIPRLNWNLPTMALPCKM